MLELSSCLHSFASAIPPGVIENVASDSGLSGLKLKNKIVNSIARMMK